MVAVISQVPDLQPTDGPDPGAGVDERPQDRPIPQVAQPFFQQRFAAITGYRDSVDEQGLEHDRASLWGEDMTMAERLPVR